MIQNLMSMKNGFKNFLLFPIPNYYNMTRRNGGQDRAKEASVDREQNGSMT